MGVDADKDKDTLSLVDDDNQRDPSPDSHSKESRVPKDSRTHKRTGTSILSIFSCASTSLFLSEYFLLHFHFY